MLTTRIAWLLQHGACLARRHSGRHLHQQGGQGNGGAPVRHAARQPARHVDRHLPRPVQPPAARAPPSGGPARTRSRFWIRKTSSRPSSGCASSSTWMTERFPPKQLAWFIAGCKEEGLRPKDVPAHDAGQPQEGRAVPALRRTVPARRRGRFWRADAALLRAAARPRPPCASITSGAFATSWSMSSRTPTGCNTCGSSCSRATERRARRHQQRDGRGR